MAVMNVGASGNVANMAVEISPLNEKTQFEQFLKVELQYHKAMQEMYESLLANSLLNAGEDSGAGEMLRTLIIAGMHQLAGPNK